MNEGATEIGPLTNGPAQPTEIGQVKRYILVTMIGMGSEGLRRFLVKKA
jgi:hypothetical protein